MGSALKSQRRPAGKGWAHTLLYASRYTSLVQPHPKAMEEVPKFWTPPQYHTSSGMDIFCPWPPFETTPSHSGTLEKWHLCGDGSPQQHTVLHYRIPALLLISLACSLPHQCWPQHCPAPLYLRKLSVFMLDASRISSWPKQPLTWLAAMPLQETNACLRAALLALVTKLLTVCPGLALRSWSIAILLSNTPLLPPCLCFHWCLVL